ncbi:MAG: sugar phosphate isomerase/epimerase, partial [Oscillospiraceae bacterium]
GYHNHQQEYENLNGKYPIDVLLEKCKTENVFFEMDTLHVAAAGESPVKFAEKYARRIPILHARDTDGTNDCTIGSGMLDFPTILSVCSTLEWIVVENCNIGFNEKELADSATYLRQILK